MFTVGKRLLTPLAFQGKEKENIKTNCNILITFLSSSKKFKKKTHPVAHHDTMCTALRCVKKTT